MDMPSSLSVESWVLGLGTLALLPAAGLVVLLAALAVYRRVRSSGWLALAVAGALGLVSGLPSVCEAWLAVHGGVAEVSRMGYRLIYVRLACGGLAAILVVIAVLRLGREHRALLEVARGRVGRG